MSEFPGLAAAVRETDHRAGDDLLSAGLGLTGLQQPLPPPDAAPLSPAWLRRRAIHSNWNGIAWLGEPDPCHLAALQAAVPGREFHTLLQLPGCRHPHRVLLQLPDSFDPRRPRLLVTAASGSRGCYGAVALAGAWGLSRGWAVATTDKACGSDWFDVASGESPALDGMPTADPQRQVFRPERLDGLPPAAVLIKHAHSGDNPEAHWGAALCQAAQFAWWQLGRLFGAPSPASATDRRCLAVGLSNGGGAVLQALAAAHPFDAAVVLAPNVYPWRGGRAFFDYLSEAALWMRCAQGDRRLAGAASPLPQATLQAQAEAAYAELCQLGLLPAGSARRGQAMAYRHLRRRGWPRQALAAARISCAYDFWYAGGLAYAQAAGRYGSVHPLGAYCASVDGDGRPRAAEPLERALRWSDGSGIVPGAAVAWVTVAPRAQVLAGLRGLWRGHDADARRVLAGIAATRCPPPRPGTPILLLHGADDGLIPPHCSSDPYARSAHAAGADLVHWRVAGAPHFDAFLGLPGYGERFRPLLPWGFRALTAIDRHLQDATPLPAAAEGD